MTERPHKTNVSTLTEMHGLVVEETLASVTNVRNMIRIYTKCKTVSNAFDPQPLSSSKILAAGSDEGKGVGENLSWQMCFHMDGGVGLSVLVCKDGRTAPLSLMVAPIMLSLFV